MTDETHKPEHGEDEPQVYAVNKSSQGWHFNRRSFLKAAGTSAAGMVALSACSTTPVPTPTTSPIPRPTNTSPPTVDPATTEGVAHKATINATVLSPDGKLLASHCSDSRDRSLKVWNTADKQLLLVWEDEAESLRASPGPVVFTPDGNVLIAGAHRWSLSNFTVIDVIPNLGGSEYAISPDGTLLAAGNDNALINLWDLNAMTVRKILSGHREYIGDLVITPDSSRLISSDGAGQIRLWSLPDGELLAEIEADTMSVSALAISPDGLYCASGAGSGNIKLWRVADLTLIRDIANDGGWVHALTFNADGTLLVSGDNGGIRFWTLPDGGLSNTVGFRSAVQSLVLSPDSSWMISGHASTVGGTGIIRQWTLPDAQPAGYYIDIAANDPAFAGVQYSPNDNGAGVVTLPCGSPIPTGSTCICNCVAGSSCTCVGHRSSGGGGHYWYPN